MKNIYLPLFLLLAGGASAQTTYASKVEAKEAIKSGYPATRSGWVIHENDTLALGRGSTPTGNFAFIYQSPGAAAFSGDYTKVFLPSSYAGRRVLVKRLDLTGTKSTGFSMLAISAVGLVYNYYIEIDNALASGELVAPSKYRSAAKSDVGTASIADELTKLKKLKDDGILSEDEFQAQKKKLLNQ